MFNVLFMGSCNTCWRMGGSWWRSEEERERDERKIAYDVSGGKKDILHDNPVYLE